MPWIALRAELEGVIELLKRLCLCTPQQAHCTPVFRYDEALTHGNERNDTPKSSASLATTESWNHGR